jgi:hypothetical protein
MSAGIFNIEIEQGTTWARTLFFGEGDKGLILNSDSQSSIAVDAVAKTFTRNDDGSWLNDGLEIGDYLVTAGFPASANNGSKIITDISAKIITCAGDTLITESAAPLTTGNPVIVLKAMDMTNCTGQSMIRKKYASLSPAATITVTFDAIRVNGMVTLSLTNTQTSAIPAGETPDASASQYVWDLELTMSGVVSRRLEGTVAVSPEATK